MAAKGAVANSLPSDVLAKVESRAKLTPKVIGRAKSIDDVRATGIPLPNTVSDDAEKGGDERRRLRWIAHYVKHGLVQEALDLGWDGKSWVTPEVPSMGLGAPEAHPVHGLVYNL